MLTTRREPPSSIAMPSRYACGMSRRNLCLTVVLLVGALAVACGDDGAPTAGGDQSNCRAPFEGDFADVEAYPVFASSQIAVGSNRLLVGLQNNDDAPIASPSSDMHIDFFDLRSCPAKPAESVDLEFMWTIKPVVGLYRGEATFDRAGIWGAEVSISGDVDETVKASFEVVEETTTPALGSPAPASDTATSDDAKDLSVISTDKKPDPRYYELSVADALKQKKPFVVVFATPKFCQSQTCGPTLDIVKSVADDYPKLTFIHVEPYELPADPTNLKSVPAAEEWGLPSEPWVFVVDAKGNVTAKYEGAIAPEELRAELAKL